LGKALCFSGEQIRIDHNIWWWKRKISD